MRRAALAGFDPAGPTVQFYRRYRRALRTGELVRPDWCQRCGASCHPDGHHDDYTEPLRVLWLCKSCHAVAHPGRHGWQRSRGALLEVHLAHNLGMEVTDLSYVVELVEAA